MMEIVRQRYGIRVEVVFPERDEVEQMVTLHGPNLFYGSVPSASAAAKFAKCVRSSGKRCQPSRPGQRDASRAIRGRASPSPK